MEFRILGPLEIQEGERSVECRGAKQRLLLAVLVVKANEVVSTDRLIDALWGEKPPATASKALQMHVSELRKALGRDVIATRAPGYELRLGPDELDLWRFERAVGDARAAASAARVAEAADGLRQALELWRGPPLADLSFEEALQPDIARLEELRLVAVEERIEADLALGRHAELIPELESLAAQQPLRERLHGQLIVALYRCGRQADALEAYREIRRSLVDELGIEPGRGLRDLEAAVLAQDEALDAPATDVASQAHRPQLFGRERELAALEPALDRLAVSRTGAIVLIGGEPGIGKSRLAHALGWEAEARGARVLVGRCWEAGDAPPYWPWVQALRSHLPGADLRALAPSNDAGSHSARFQLFEATAGLLRDIAAEQPLAVFFDDIHAADAPSLLLLRFAASTLHDAPVLLVACYRSSEIGPELDEALVELGRHVAVTHLVLEGIDRAGTQQLLEAAMQTTASPPLVERVHARTGGNPLFAGEVGRLLASRAWDEESVADRGFPVPEGVRAAITSRIQRQSERSRDLLAMAAVVGREFDVQLLARLSGSREGDLLSILEEAHAARILEASPGGHGRLRFSHVLVRDALYDELSPARRLRLHRDVAAAIEELHGHAIEPHLSELAAHYGEAGGDYAAEALSFTIRAGEYAAAQLGYEEAARHFRNALELTEATAGLADAERMCDVLLALGDALSRAGDEAGAKNAFRRAAANAEATGNTDQLARAALGYGGRFPWARGSTDPDLVPLYERALTAVGDTQTSARAVLLVRLAAARRERDPAQRRRAMTDEGIEIARRMGDPAVLAHTLNGSLSGIGGPDDVTTRLVRTDELLVVANDIGDRELLYNAHANRLHTYWALADRPRVDAELEAMSRLAQDLRQPAQRWEYSASLTILALMEGAFERAEELIVHTAALGERVQSWNARVSERVALFALRREQGRLRELEAPLERATHEYPTLLRFQTGLAHVHAALGRERPARDLLDDLIGRDLVHGYWDEEWLVAMNLLPDVCTFLGDADAAGRLYDLLVPYDRLYAVAPSEMPFGSVARGLGILARTFGQVDRAVAHLEAAIEMESSMRARPWIAHAQHDLAETLLLRNRAGDRQRASDLAQAAVGAYRELGMEPWAERALA